MPSVLKESTVGRVPASRVRGPRRILKSLRRVLIATNRARVARAVTPEEILWCDRVLDAMVTLINEGDAVLPLYVDPRDMRRIRKRKRAQ